MQVQAVVSHNVCCKVTWDVTLTYYVYSDYRRMQKSIKLMLGSGCQVQLNILYKLEHCFFRYTRAFMWSIHTYMFRLDYDANVLAVLSTIATSYKTYLGKITIVHLFQVFSIILFAGDLESLKTLCCTSPHGILT